MKKSLLAAVAALAIVGCTQNEEIENAGQKAEINFGTMVSKTTRAAVTEDAELQASGFIVYAYNTGGDITADDTKLGDAFMSGVKVTHSSTEWAVDGGPYYWPFEGKVHFFAYAEGAGATGYSVATNAKYPTINYTIKTLASEQTDFVVAKSINKVKTTDAVTLSFTHALTQVNFSMKGADNLTYKITALGITGVANSGTYSFADDTWKASGTAGIYAYPIAGDASVTGTTAVPLDQEKGALMLMPQEMTEAAKITLSYGVYNGSVKVDQVTNAEIELNNTDAWKVGKKVRYTLTLSNTAANVKFDTEIGAWNTKDDTEPVVPSAK